MSTHRIAVIPADGIGVEVTNEGIKVLNHISKLDPNIKFEYTNFPWGCEYYLKTGKMMDEDGLEQLKKFDAIYENCVIKCKIDKATNRVTWANYYTPFTIDANIKIIVDLATTVVMSYERDYTITY